MSFILNALRKSEQERQSLQPEAVTDRILINHSEQKQSKSAFFLCRSGSGKYSFNCRYCLVRS